MVFGHRGTRNRCSRGQWKQWICSSMKGLKGQAEAGSGFERLVGEKQPRRAFGDFTEQMKRPRDNPQGLRLPT